MRKIVLSFLVSSMLATFVISPTSAASPSKGAACKVLGSIQGLPSNRFICVKSGKKLIWQVYTAKPAAPTASSTQMSTTTSGTTTASTSTASTTTTTVAPQKPPFKAPIPITLPVAPVGNITFSNILDHISDIPQVAWQSVQDVISRNQQPAPITNEVHVGPTTQIDVKGGLPRIQDLLKRSQKLWSGFTQVSTFNLLMYNATDEKWAEQDWTSTVQTKKYFPNLINDEITRIAGNCQQTLSPGKFSGTPSNCRGADSSAITSTDDAILTFGQGGDGAANDPFVTGGGIVGHEYIHSVQAAQWIGKPSSYCTPETQTPKCNRSWDSNWGFSPCWIFEGLPNSVGPMTVADTFTDYQNYRRNLPYGQGPTTVTDYTTSSLHDYLVNQSHSSCYSNGNIYRLGYTAGALTVEALVAIGGPQAVMALYSLGAVDQDFETAFQNVYGISWADAAAILSKVLGAEYQTFGQAPK